MPGSRINIDTLIEIVSRGGAVKTGVDIINRKGLLLLEKDVLVTKVKTLLLIKHSGVYDIPIHPELAGGVWDNKGRQMSFGATPPRKQEKKAAPAPRSEIEKKIQTINQLKKEASVRYEKAKESTKQVFTDIKKTGGEIDLGLVKQTVQELFDFLTVNESAFSYLTKEILNYDDYLYNHSINVCTIGTAILNRFNDNFSEAINKHLVSVFESTIDYEDESTVSYVNYLPADMQDVSLGFFMHDIGKILIPDKILNKKGPLTAEEFEIVKTHSYEKGVEILEKNKIDNPYTRNIAKYHHSALFVGEDRCYPQNRLPIEIPLYVKICKLADIYDAMTSKRCYKDACNPTTVVTDIFRRYAEKDHILQFMLHSFVKSIGIYPPGSIVTLNNNQLAYVMDSSGPLVIPFTDTKGDALKKQSAPINLAEQVGREELQINRRKPLNAPIEVYDKLPSYLKSAAPLEK
ncbi:MAG: HD domain-containing protein [Proteobacteria bacterium]|nr:HD domain-containing protein [Pseudomonadota bacterium]MBU1709638.1 HD domain-containing protein [Pseudomonadota bacterium]